MERQQGLFPLLSKTQLARSIHLEGQHRKQDLEADRIYLKDRAEWMKRIAVAAAVAAGPAVVAVAVVAVAVAVAEGYMPWMGTRWDALEA